MNIVATGMHDANLSPGIIFRADSAGIRQPGILLHGKSVQLRAQHDDRTASILQQSNDAGAAYMLGNLVSSDSEFIRQLARRFSFVSRQFWMLVKINVQGMRVRINTLNFL